MTFNELLKKSIHKVNDQHSRSRQDETRANLETDQLKFPDYVVAVLSVPTSVTDKDIIPAFQVFDTEKRGLLEVDEILKSLLTVGEKLDELEANTFKENLTINEQGLFDYNGKSNLILCALIIVGFISFVRIISQIHSTTTNQNKKERKKEEEEKIILVIIIRTHSSFC